MQIPADGYDVYRKAALAKSSKSRQIFYTVRYGDTLSEIAVKFSTSVRKLKKWNCRRTKKSNCISGEKSRNFVQL